MDGWIKQIDKWLEGKQTYEEKNVWLDGWMDRKKQMYGWMDGQRKIDGYKNMAEWMYIFLKIDGWLDGQENIEGRLD